jgi:hypothetical protein
LACAPVFVEDFNAVSGFDEHDAPFRDRTIAECPPARQL